MTLRRFRKIIACCPHSVTGGPELLHQFVDQMRHLGHDAHIHYYPSDAPYSCPDPYRHYDAPRTAWDDADDTLFILPEVATRLIFRVKRGQVAIWWLSVESYYATRSLNVLSRIGHVAAKTAFLFFVLRRYEHLAQSEYARAHLARYGIRAHPLGDHLNPDYLTHAHKADEGVRENIILYNPKKGAAITQRLIDFCSDFDFVPIRNLSREEVLELMRRAKLYVDFGHHPGKDRMPREAAIAGCCIITGQQGAAGNDIDVAIPRRYKLDERDSDFLSRFQEAARDVFKYFDERTDDFRSYRNRILKEPAQFRHQARTLFGDALPSDPDSAVAAGGADRSSLLPPNSTIHIK